MKKQDLAPHIDWIIKNQAPDARLHGILMTNVIHGTI